MKSESVKKITEKFLSKKYRGYLVLALIIIAVFIGVAVFAVRPKTTTDQTQNLAISSLSVDKTVEENQFDVDRKLYDLVPKKVTKLIDKEPDKPKPQSVKRISFNKLKYEPKNAYDENRVLPFGYRVPVVLTEAIQTSNIGSPVIGYVSENVYWKGELLIPVRTEVHGKLAPGRLRDLAITQEQWVLRYPDGDTIEVRAKALNADKDPDRMSWGLDDGVEGIKGDVRLLDPNAEIKGIFKNSLAAAALAFQERETNNVTGIEQSATSVQNALLTGVAAGFQRSAQLEFRKLTENNIYVEVGAANTFYLYFLENVYVDNRSRQKFADRQQK